MGYFTMAFMQAIPGRVFGSILSNELLLAIPFFTFMGAILDEMRAGGRHARNRWASSFGPIKGGLGYSTIIVGFILGAITAPWPPGHRHGADHPAGDDANTNTTCLRDGVLAASGTITQLVPPSLVLIVLADQLGKSVGDMYLGAWGPSLLQIALFAGYTFYRHARETAALPPVPRTLFGKALLVKCAWASFRRRADLPRARHHHDGVGDAHRGGRDGHDRRHRARGGCAMHRSHRFDRSCSSAGCAAAIIGALIGIVAFKSLAFQAAFTVMFAAIIWLCWRAWQSRTCAT